MDSKLKKEVIGIVLALMIFFAIIISFVLYNQLPLSNGKTIVLDTAPVDPFDPFRGQYMIINYEISTFPNKDFKQGDTVYVSLKEDAEGIWRFVDSSKVKPSSGDFIKGKVTNVFSNDVRVDYGIEQFFFEKDAKVPTQDITVEVKVTDSGRAALVQLLQDGKPVEIQYENFSWTS